MESVILNIESLPQHIRKVLRTKNVAVQERDGGIFLQPVLESSGLFGIATNDKLTLEKFMSFKKEDKESEG